MRREKKKTLAVANTVTLRQSCAPTIMITSLRGHRHFTAFRSGERVVQAKSLVLLKRAAAHTEAFTVKIDLENQES
jgi:hypothetical protein